MMMVLAPSSISVNDLFPVAEKLLGRQLHDQCGICRFVFGDKEPELLPRTICIDELATEIVVAYSKHDDNMLSMRSSEPCGVPLLGHSSVILCDLLNKESSTKKFAILMEYSVVTTALPGKNPSADAAVLSIVSNDIHYYSMSTSQWSTHVDFPSMPDTLWNYLYKGSTAYAIRE